MKPIEQFTRIPLFQGLDRKQHAALAAILVDRAFKRGENIFSEGDEGIGFYIIVSGRAKIFKLSSDGKEQILHIFGPGEPIGEAAVFAGKKFPAHAAALEETRTFFFPRNAFVDLIRKDPSMALTMLAVLSHRLHQFTSLVEDLSLKEVPGRLASYLLLLSQRGKGKSEVSLDISKSQLASLLGTIPETLSRILAKLTREGLIQLVGQRQIRLIDRRGLEELAAGERRLSEKP